MNTDRREIQSLVEHCVQKGIEHVVISPGSRNAALTIAFTNHPKIKTYSIVDERCASFFAMGIAQQTRKPVVISCTSGSAALNFAPGIVEAYYQKVPLIVMTADRPNEWIDQGEGQSIRQENIYANYIKKSFNFPNQFHTENDHWHAERLLSEAINVSEEKGNQGPVHINIPFTEPLYNLTEEKYQPKKVIHNHHLDVALTDDTKQALLEEWRKHDRKVIVVGQMVPDGRLNGILKELSEKDALVVLKETTSNLNDVKSIASIDRLMVSIEEDPEGFQAGLLISIGDAIVSKKVKAYFRKYKAKAHWHIHPSGETKDTYQSLTDLFQVEPSVVLQELVNETVSEEQKKYVQTWNERNLHLIEEQAHFDKNAPYSDYLVFKELMQSIPNGSNIQLGNSTVVRYSNLFELSNAYRFDCNRGTSGIEGVVSTAAGASIINQENTTVITGDVSFFYDSNALWNNYIQKGLKIILINNGGGGIFNIIPGPSTVDDSSTYFETEHQLDASKLADSFNVAYSNCNNLETLQNSITSLYSSDKTEILEVFTDRKLSAEVLKKYFEQLKELVKVKD